ncbi:TonB-dependent receptor [Chitinispirillales bacterium ANBcel5]|uniref:TonB-dependent receptor n=1 Tax=Cellulosispirillum alkaliphilum TaxID=3039283 RepID=UPI002A5625FB|nr:TonB-dependent receptor [Chitinispirillales bacterium ANBcel5]
MLLFSFSHGVRKLHALLALYCTLAFAGEETHSIKVCTQDSSLILQSDDKYLNSMVSQDQSVDSFELEEVVVTARRRQELLEKTQSYTIIKPEEWQGTTKSVADVIAEQTGVQTRRYGGVGSFQTVSMRGVQGGRVLVLLDGIPLNSAMGGAVDLGAISSERIGEIEIYKGITPGKFGGNALGGVINIRSKRETDEHSVNSRTSRGAYGFKNYHVEVSSPFNNHLNLFGSVEYTGSENNWPYMDRNRTPHNPDDDRIETVKNHHYSRFEARAHPSINIFNDRTLITGISYSTSESGIPAEEGAVNRTANHGRENITLNAVLKSDETHRTSTFLFTPEAGYIRWSSRTFWTSLDESMGTSHGGITSVRNGQGLSETDLHVINLSCVSDIVFTDNFAAQISLHGKHSQILTNTEVTSFPRGDWPGSSQEATLAKNLNLTIPIGKREFGVSTGGSLKGLRSSTDGGYNRAFEMTIQPSVTVDYPWSLSTGLHFRPFHSSVIYFNAARFSHVPSLREKFGSNGAVLPNPDLKEETGLSFEAGGRYLGERFFFESVFFRNEIKNGIVLLNDGNMTKPVNMGRVLSSGIEVSSWYKPLDLLKAEVKATIQNVENRTRLYNYYGNMVPNEPNFSGIAKLTLKPVEKLKIQYWSDYKSFFFRDYANIKRVPDKTAGQSGIIFHNAAIFWKPATQFEINMSIINFNRKYLRYEDMLQTTESGYSWTLFPANEWNFTIGVYL